jgi:predicted AlkP superfamily phosphohydrolase/phosphomutase
MLPTWKFTGPFRHDGPDLIIGYNTGYRCSWPGAAGQVTDTVICENTQVWSGDHCVDPELVPGVLFSNYPFKDETPRIVDIAPTILDLFGVASSTPMQGQSLFGGCVVHNA